MSGYRSFMWSRKAGIVQRALRPAALDGEALLAHINNLGRLALRLRGFKAAPADGSTAAQKIRAKARLHLLRAERLILKLGETDVATKAALLRSRLE